MDHIRMIQPGDDEWPPGLHDLADDMPEQLYLAGDLDLAVLTKRSIALVGARAATSYGGHVASELAYNLSNRDVTVVSGGAFGIDALAHRGALAAGKPTVCVVATGLDISYPRSHDRLFGRIESEGLMVTEYAPGTSPRPVGFLRRNRLIAAMSTGLVVVEAAVRSGALNAARRAAECGRPVMAVPGPVTSAVSAGCHMLIRDGGAHLVTCTDDVLAFTLLDGS